TDIAGAVAAVPDGAVLLVRASSYGPFTVAGKGVTILCEPNTVVLDAVTISGTSSSQRVTLSQLTWPAGMTASSFALLDIHNCVGPVLLQGLSQPAFHSCALSSPFGCLVPIGIGVRGCPQVLLRDSTILCTASFTDSDVAVEACRIEGEYGLWTNSGSGPLIASRTALSLRHGRTQI